MSTVVDVGTYDFSFLTNFYTLGNMGLSEVKMIFLRIFFPKTQTKSSQEMRGTRARARQ